LQVLLEATELYCLVSPGGAKVDQSAWYAIYQGTDASPYTAQVQFAATHGEALLSIAEYLVEDVLLVSNAAAAPKPTGSAAADTSPCSTGGTSSSSTSSSSSSSRRPRAGAGNAAVTLEHRVWWAQCAVTTLGHLMRHQQLPWEEYPEDGTYLEQQGKHVIDVTAYHAEQTASIVTPIIPKWA